MSTFKRQWYNDTNTVMPILPQSEKTGNRNMIYCNITQEEFEDTKGVIRIRNRKTNNTMQQWRKGQRNKQRYTTHTHKTKDRVTRTPLKPATKSGTPVLLLWVQSGDKSCMENEPVRDYDKRNISSVNVWTA